MLGQKPGLPKTNPGRPQDKPVIQHRGRSQGMLSHGPSPMPYIPGVTRHEPAPWTARDTAKVACLAVVGMGLLVTAGWAAKMLLDQSRTGAAAAWLGIVAAVYFGCLIKGGWNRSSLPAHAIVLGGVAGLLSALLLLSMGAFLLTRWAWVALLRM